MSTIAAISTPLSSAGLGVIRVSGEEAIEISQKVFKSQNGVLLKDKKGYTATLGKVFDEKGDIDEAIALVFRAPLSYTGEDVVEFSLHGGVFVLERTLKALVLSGADLAGRGEFTKRAFLNGKMTLTEAESVMDIISAQGLSASRAALEVKDGALFKQISEIKENLINTQSHIAAYIDFPEEDVEAVEFDAVVSLLSDTQTRLNSLISSYNKGKILREGVKTAIVGKPNVGKSTLMNRLSGFEKSIVTSVAGTTRDVVEENIRLKNINLRLFDTAGMRETTDEVEKIGVELANKNIESADLILAVFDASEKLDENDKTLINKIKDRTVICVINKTDKEILCDINLLNETFKNTVSISAKTDLNLTQLEELIEKVVDINGFDTASGILSNMRQLECAKKAYESTLEAKTAVLSGVTLDAVGVLVENAIESLLSLTGESVSEEVIDKVFSNFCVGK